jgi:hypothetical protein
MPKVYNVDFGGVTCTMEAKMLRTDEKTHKRFMQYIAQRFVETGEKKTVTQTLNELLDSAERVERGAREADR